MDQKVLYDKIDMTIFRHDLLFSFVEYDGIRDIIKQLNKDVKYISRAIIAQAVLKFYEKKKGKLSEFFKKLIREFLLLLMFGLLAQLGDTFVLLYTLLINGG